VPAAGHPPHGPTPTERPHDPPECCGWDEMSEELRQMVLDRDGVARIRIDSESGRSLSHLPRSGALYSVTEGRPSTS